MTDRELCIALAKALGWEMKRDGAVWNLCCGERRVSDGFCDRETAWDDAAHWMLTGDGMLALIRRMRELGYESGHASLVNGPYEAHFLNARLEGAEESDPKLERAVALAALSALGGDKT